MGETTHINKTGSQQQIGSDWDNKQFSGYMTEIQFIDGQELTPEHFIEPDYSRVDQLSPKKVEDWFGTRGYHLSMSNPTALYVDSSTSG